MQQDTMLTTPVIKYAAANTTAPAKPTHACLFSAYHPTAAHLGIDGEACALLLAQLVCVHKVVAEGGDSILDARGMHHAITLKPAGTKHSTQSTSRKVQHVVNSATGLF
jgi:hypothetical protein